MWTEDPADWIPRLLQETWPSAVDELVAEGFDLPVKLPPLVHAPKDKTSRTHTGRTRVKVYEAAPLDSMPQSWGDTDRDLTMAWEMQVVTEGEQARPASHSARLIIDRVFQLHRKHPHPDWDGFESWRSNLVEDWSNKQRLVYTVNLARRGVRMAVSLKDR